MESKMSPLGSKQGEACTLRLGPGKALPAATTSTTAAGMSRRTLALGLAALGLGWPNLGLTAHFVVAFSQDAADTEWRVAQARQLSEAFGKLPDLSFEIAQGGGSTAQQIIDIDAVVQRRVNLLIVSPRDTTLLAEPVARAHRAGIRVMLITRRVDGEAFTTPVGPDDEAIGRAAARLIAARLKGRGNVLMLKGRPTTSTAVARSQGFVDELQRHPGLKLVDTRTANHQRSEAIRETEDVLKMGTRWTPAMPRTTPWPAARAWP